MGFPNAFAVDRTGRDGGLALLWRGDVDLIIRSYTSLHIDVVITEGSGSMNWRITGFYGRPEAAKNKGVWALLEQLASMDTLPWLCIGDFNEIMCAEEKKGGSLWPEYLMDDFLEALSICSMLHME